ncbi:MAG: MFS transporter, partial [Gemmatimonadaceae bacterium]
FHSTFIVALAIVSAIAVVTFLVWELTDDDPIVDLRLFRHRNFAAGTLVLVLSFSVFFGMELVSPLWTQRVLGYTAMWAGFAMAPIGFFPVLLVFIVGKYGPRVDLRLLAAFAFVIFGVSSWLTGSFNTQVNFASLFEVRLLQGLGVAFFFMPVLTILLSDLEGPEIAAGSGTSTFLRQLGSGFSASIVTFLWDRGAAAQHVYLSAHVNPYNPISVQALSAFSVQRQQQALATVNNLVTQQGFQLSFDHIATTLGLITFALIPVLLLAKPPFLHHRPEPAKR